MKKFQSSFLTLLFTSTGLIEAAVSNGQIYETFDSGHTYEQYGTHWVESYYSHKVPEPVQDVAESYYSFDIPNEFHIVETEPAPAAPVTPALPELKLKPAPIAKKGPSKKAGKKDDRKMNCEECAASVKKFVMDSIEDLQNEIDDLKNQIADLESSQDQISEEIEAIGDQPSETLLSKTSFLAVGTGYTFLTFPARRNSTFGTVVDPVFLWRYGDNVLFEMKLDLQFVNCATNLSLVYATLDYVYNDLVTFRVGKYSLPLGLVWEKMTTGWINKLPTLPLPYNPRGFALTPAADVGLDIRGAFEAGHWFGLGCKEGIQSVIAYDLWVGNGPEESAAGDIILDCDYDDNNYNKSLGARIGLRPQPFREIGFSCMTAQWNNNSRSGYISSRKHLYYTAAVIDLNWRFTENSKWMGEYIWTGRDVVKRKSQRIKHGKLIQTGWWLQYSSFLNIFEGFLCKGSKEKPFWSDFEFVVRASQVDSDIEDRSRRQLTFGLNYYIKNTLLVKAAYDINQGKAIGKNRFTLQVAYAY